MFDWFKKKQKNSGSVAKERLNLVLTADRNNTSSEFLETLRSEIFDSLSKHIDFNPNEVDIKINRSQNGGTKYELRANIPYKRKRK